MEGLQKRAKDEYSKELFEILKSKIDDYKEKLSKVYKMEIDSANKILGNALASDFWPIFSYLSDDNEDDDPEEMNSK